MPESIDDVHRDVARIVLRAIGEHQAGSRFGLAGGNALSAHGLLNRSTEDVDIALGTLDRFTEAADAAGEALADNGYTVHLVDERSGWEDDDDEVGLAEMVAVTADGGRQIQVQIGYFDLLASPVTMAGLGPVCGLDDVAGHKTVALANRMLTRDYVDVAALRTRYPTSQLIALAVERDPGLRPADFADAIVRLDRMRDGQLEEILSRTSLTAAWVRGQFADWPRDAPPREDDLMAGDWQ
jgi:Nucleotidyl transferase AbiEii toxin, Type IV TA system